MKLNSALPIKKEKIKAGFVSSVRLALASSVSF